MSEEHVAVDCDTEVCGSATQECSILTYSQWIRVNRDANASMIYNSGHGSAFFERAIALFDFLDELNQDYVEPALKSFDSLVQLESSASTLLAVVSAGCIVAAIFLNEFVGLVGGAIVDVSILAIIADMVCVMLFASGFVCDDDPDVTRKNPAEQVAEHLYFKWYLPLLERPWDERMSSCVSKTREYGDKSEILLTCASTLYIFCIVPMF